MLGLTLVSSRQPSEPVLPAGRRPPGVVALRASAACAASLRTAMSCGPRYDIAVAYRISTRTHMRPWALHVSSHRQFCGGGTGGELTAQWLASGRCAPFRKVVLLAADISVSTSGDGRQLSAVSSQAAKNPRIQVPRACFRGRRRCPRPCRHIVHWALRLRCCQKQGNPPGFLRCAVELTLSFALSRLSLMTVLEF